MTTPSTHPVSAMIDKIQSTNNGYLFSPSEGEIQLAKKHPTIFQVEHQPSQQIFPYKISLR